MVFQRNVVDAGPGRCPIGASGGTGVQFETAGCTRELNLRIGKGEQGVRVLEAAAGVPAYGDVRAVQIVCRIRVGEVLAREQATVDEIPGGAAFVRPVLGDLDNAAFNVNRAAYVLEGTCLRDPRVAPTDKTELRVPRAPMTATSSGAPEGNCWQIM